METERLATLHKLSDAKLTVKNPEDDVRGRKVLAKDGHEVGSVDDLMIDDIDQKVRFLQVTSGGFLGMGETTFLIPVDAVTNITKDAVHVDQTAEHLAGVPPYNPVLATGKPDLDDGYYSGLYGYFGLSPYWDPDYQYPTYPHYDQEVIERDRVGTGNKA